MKVSYLRVRSISAVLIRLGFCPVCLVFFVWLFFLNDWLSENNIT